MCYARFFYTTILLYNTIVQKATIFLHPFRHSFSRKRSSRQRNGDDLTRVAVLQKPRTGRNTCSRSDHVIHEDYAGDLIQDRQKSLVHAKKCLRVSLSFSCREGLLIRTPDAAPAKERCKGDAQSTGKGAAKPIRLIKPIGFRTFMGARNVAKQSLVLINPLLTKITLDRKGELLRKKVKRPTVSVSFQV